MGDAATWHKQLALHRRRWLVLLFTLGVSAGLCKLALWQWQRAAEKEAWLEQVAAAQQVAPLMLDRLDWRELDKLDGAVLSGRVAWFRPYVWLLDNQTVEGEIGYDVIIPVRANDDTALAGTSSSKGPLLLVNLGWIAAPASRDQLPAPVIPPLLELDGLLRTRPGGLLLGQNIEGGPYPNRIQSVRAVSLSEETGLPLADAVFYQKHSPFRYHYQHNVMPPEKHRAYALQWLGLAVVMLVGGLVLTRRVSS
ncbi:SURF1 family protein [Aeromonas intestinalis]